MDPCPPCKSSQCPVAVSGLCSWLGCRSERRQFQRRRARAGLPERDAFRSSYLPVEEGLWRERSINSWIWTDGKLSRGLRNSSQQPSVSSTLDSIRDGADSCSYILLRHQDNSSHQSHFPSLPLLFLSPMVRCMRAAPVVPR